MQDAVAVVKMVHGCLVRFREFERTRRQGPTGAGGLLRATNPLATNRTGSPSTRLYTGASRMVRSSDLTAVVVRSPLTQMWIRSPAFNSPAGRIFPSAVASGCVAV